MVRRLIMSAAKGAKLSKPGVDVTGAPAGGLLFDSEATQLKLLIRGRFNLPSWGSSGSKGTMEAIYPGGLVLPRVPIAIFGDGSGSSGLNLPSPPTASQHVRSFFGVEYSYNGKYSGSNNHGEHNKGDYYLACQALVDRVRIVWDYDDVSQVAYSMYYAVFENAS